MRSTVWLATVLLALACNSPKPVSNPPIITKDTIKSNPDELNKKIDAALAYTPQYFNIAAHSKKEITGKKGIRIKVDTDDLETQNGEAVTGEVKLELLELTDLKDLLSNNCQTVSDGSILSSGGSYYIGMSSGGKKLKLKPGKKLMTQFPRIRNEKMQLYYGQRDSAGNMNWKEIGQKLVARKTVKSEPLKLLFGSEGQEQEAQAMTQKEWQVQKNKRSGYTFYLDGDSIPEEKLITEKIMYYEPAELDQLGWVNVDCIAYPDIVFIKNYMFRFKNLIPADLKIYMAIPRKNALLTDYLSGNHSLDSTVMKPLPNGDEIKFVLVQQKQDEFYSATAICKMHNGLQIPIEFKKVPASEMKTKLITHW